MTKNCQNGLLMKVAKKLTRNCKVFNTMSKKESPEKEIENASEEKESKKTKSKSKRGSRSSKKVDELKAQIEELNAEKGELKDKFLRLFAEFDNYKKRTMKERLELVNTAAAKTIQGILPVIDDFDRAVKAAEDDSNAEPLSEGMLMIHKRIKTSLQQQGLTEMESTGEVFNPDFHEALSEIPASEDMKGKIIDTIEKGYTLNDKIIRHARVVVGK